MTSDPSIPCLSTITLRNRGLRLAARAHLNGLPPYGCVARGDARRLSTHSVPGYGAVCAEHAAGEPRAAPEPWAAEAVELDRRGLRREHE